jgi:imidazolonepropionase-like amidohydrolase
LLAHGITAVRDLGSNLDTSLAWRDEIAAGRRRGPRIYTAGVILDGPKDGASPRWTLRTPGEAERAVDSLAARGVDLIKTHNGLAHDVFFAVLRRARHHGLRVAAHLPRGVPAWVAADSGAGSIEHAAESILASPIYAGHVSTAADAMAWWDSPAGDSALSHLAGSGVSVTPTLIAYAASIERAPDSVRALRRDVLTFLVALTGRMHRAGIPLMAGSDPGPVDGAIVPGRHLLEELEWLRQAGLSDEEVHRTATTNVETWLATGR